MALEEGGRAFLAQRLASMLRFPVIALAAIVAAVLGTDRLGRALTHEEKKTLGAELRAHDYEGARLIALRFAFRLTRERAQAHDLLDRVDDRLVRLGWDPAEIPLVRYLCRLTWSEWTHGNEERAKVHRAEDTYRREREMTEGSTAPSAEERATDAETKSAAETEAKNALRKLRAWFEAEGDVVNLLWLDAALLLETGLPDAQTLAAQTGRDVSEFYAAAKRRKRAAARLLAGD
jgi:hypothetical protein